MTHSGGPAAAGTPAVRLRLATGNAASGRRLGRTYDVGPWARAAATLEVDVLAVQEVDHRLPRSGYEDQTARIAAALAERPWGDGASRGGGASRRDGAGPADGDPHSTDTDAPRWTHRFAPAVLGTPGSRRTMRPATAEPGSDRLRSDLEAAGGYGVALVTRLPVLEWHELRMAPSRLPAPVPDEQRAALAAVLHTRAGPLTVVTTHLSFVPPRARRQLAELLDWAAALPRPLVLMGDLNLPAPLPERVSGWQPGPRSATFPAAAPVVQLDHVLLDPGPSARSADGRAVRLTGSDHLALALDVLLG